MHDAEPLRVMSWNIRYGTAPDGPDAWPERRPLLFRVLRETNPVVVGVQEALRFQLDEIEAELPHFQDVGLGRDDGKEGGEHASILFDGRRLERIEDGTFWLSDTPEAPGSMTWGNRFPRIVTWARFRDRTRGQALKQSFYVYNTHWDHESPESRDRSVNLMMKRIERRAAVIDPVIITGDFNSSETATAFRLLTDAFVDTFRVRHPDATETGTYHAFLGVRNWPKIDAVCVSREWHVVDAAIDHANHGGRYPSDHFPVTATVLLPAG